MCRVKSSPSVSTTSSQQGQIITPERPPRRFAGGLPPSPDPKGETDEEFTAPAKPVKRARAAAGDDGGAEEAAAGDGIDRISDMPDTALIAILSHLPLHDAGRTAVLSSRWRRIFDDSLLDLDASQPWPPDRRHDSEWVLRAVTSMLAARPRARVRSFRLAMYGPGFAGREGIVDGLLHTLVRRGIQELDVSMLYSNLRQILPASLLNLSSLKTLKASNCIFPVVVAQRLRLTSLRTLYLSDVNLSDDPLHVMLANCRALECVKLKTINGLHRIRLRSNSLKRLLGDFNNLNELVVEDAPSLEQLVGIHLPSGRAKVKIVSAPKLEVLGYLGTTVRPVVLRDAVFDTCALQGGILQLRTLMCSVKTLSMQVPFSEGQYAIAVPQWLRCFPCLEELSIKADEQSISRSVPVKEWGPTSSIPCLGHSLRKVVFENFAGEKCQVGFLKFLLTMAGALEVVEFNCPRSVDEDWAREQGELICNCNIASSDAIFMFYRRLMPVSNLYLCHCCQQRCQEENSVFLCSYSDFRGPKSENTFSSATEE